MNVRHVKKGSNKKVICIHMKKLATGKYRQRPPMTANRKPLTKHIANSWQTSTFGQNV